MKGRGLVKKRFLLPLLFGLLMLLSCASAEEAPFPLTGTWRFAGGAEVLDFGFTLAEDGTCILYTTDDFESFPPERLLARDLSCAWETNAAGTVLILHVEQDSRHFPLSCEPAARTARGFDRIHLAEGDGGGFYERCDASAVIPMDPIPDEVIDDILAWDPEARVLGYHVVREVPGNDDLPAGDYGFALVEHADKRELRGYCMTVGRLINWLSSSACIPQNDLPISFLCDEKGMTYERLCPDGESRLFTADGLDIGVCTTNGESLVDYAVYRWQEKGFLLSEYHHDMGWCTNIFDDQLVYFDIGNGYDSTVTSGYLERDIRLVDFAALPRSPDEARLDPGKVPEVGATDEGNVPCEENVPFEGYDPAYALVAHDLPFDPDERYYVYLGPGREYGRAGDGKAAVSTNGWIQVFGEYDGWLLIQYGVNETRFRIGWITAKALPRGVTAPALSFVEKDWCTLGAAWDLTDDPLSSREALCRITPDEAVERLAYLGEDWSYVRVKINKTTWWGFLPNELLGHG